MAMAAIPSQSFLAAFLPVARASLATRTPNITSQILNRIPLLHNLRIAPEVFLPIPSIIDTIWEGVLRAVPKKKTSHMKKRHRQMAGKALKDVTALNTCSSCGRAKRAHILCPYCVKDVKNWIMDVLGARSKLQKEEQASITTLRAERRLVSRNKRQEMEERELSKVQVKSTSSAVKEARI